MTDFTVGSYLVSRLEEVGVRHVFGVPGDYVLGFMDEIVHSPIELIGTCNELNAGYAADAYARLNGVGAVCVTYAVGGFSVLNAIAGAYAERVPVIAICGGPNQRDREQRRLLHHRSAAERGRDTQRGCLMQSILKLDHERQRRDGEIIERRPT